MIKAVIFDMGGVIVDNVAPGMRAHYSESLGVTVEQFNKVFENYSVAWEKGQLTEDDFWEKITSDLHVSKPTVESLWLDGFLKNYREKDEIVSLIKELKQKKYHIALLSNTEIPIMNHIKKQSWPDFDLFVYSCEVGMRKPDKEIYDYTLDNLQVKPEDSVFIDDRRENITTANEIGMHGILFESPEQVIQELEALGVSV